MRLAVFFIINGLKPLTMQATKNHKRPAWKFLPPQVKSVAHFFRGQGEKLPLPPLYSRGLNAASGKKGSIEALI